MTAAAQPAFAIHASRPPRSRLVSAPPIADHPEPPPPPIPITSPEKPWDRCKIATSPYRDVWRDESMTLDDPLPADAPNPVRTAGAAIIYALQILLGHRPASSLRNWVVPEVYGALSRRAGLAMRLHGRAERSTPPRIHRLHVSRPRCRVAEITAVADDGAQVRAAALRLEFLRHRWRIVALEIG